MKILLLEDDKLLNDAIERYLHAKGHRVTAFRNGGEVLQELQSRAYDLLIFDISVPGIDGLSLLERLHGQRIMTPVIFISAIVDIEDISRAFDLGCHDYLKKPFHLKELMLRIEKILQTHYVSQAHVRLSANYSFDREKGQLYFQNEVQILTRRQLQIIDLLARNRSRVVSYDMFRDYVYDDYDIDTGTIRAEVNRLKKVLKEDIIVNVRGIGYLIERPL